MGDMGAQQKKPLSQTLCQVGERNGASPDDFTKWEVAKWNSWVESRFSGYARRFNLIPQSKIRTDLGRIIHGVR